MDHRSSYYPDLEGEKKRLFGLDFDHFTAVILTTLEANTVRQLFGTATRAS